ncbi:Peptidase family M23 [Spongiibacter sp. IMCC21906]|uniref:M23 family metallopeptidase n=1 Tax=Spongiibacter sp. IMCC21906 TaxID=1620392 RepID=UPI00062DEFA8|nr:M23 family metallopeptidase [Spongiibacter sp. IMCC21906]AKH68754.1 Peptidase family M23 [Spongiibacter sp. IMCC21906]
MREHYRVTITSFEGARHYTVTQLMRRFMAGIIVLLATIFLGGFLIIFFMSSQLSSLSGEVQTLQNYQAKIKLENSALLKEQQQLQATVDDKVAALSMMSDELGNIETMMGLSPEPEEALYQRLDTATQTAQEKRYMLTAIPSGYPLSDPSISSSYGMRKHPVLGTMKLHGGTDLRARMGTPVYATADGVVEWSGNHNSGYGNLVKLDHNYGFATMYGHLSKTIVSVGDYVRQGDLLGYSGNSGLSSAPHLHYEVRHLHRRLSPRAFMEWSWENYDGLFTREEKIKWDSLAKTLRKATVPLRQERQLSQLAPVLSATSS